MKTKKYGLIGGKISYSYSPIIHEKVFKELGIDAEYSLLEPKLEELPMIVKKLREKELSGINVTIPYKTAIMEYLDEISPSAKAIGAVNTVMLKDNKLVGYNTDYDGFKTTLESMNLEIKHKRNFVCGAGGSARAIIKCLEDMGSKSYLVSRDKIKARENFINFEGLEVINYDELEKIENKNLIVNCTPCGTYPNIETSVLEDHVKDQYNGGIDIVYNPEITRFLKGFKKSENGLLMLVAQAVKAEEIWQEANMSMEVIQRIYEDIYKLVYKK